MLYFRYDQTFEGLLTVVFDAYARRQFPEGLLGEEEPVPLFGEVALTVVTDTAKADRVWKGLGKHISASARSALTCVWLSEMPEVDLLLFRYMRKAIDSTRSIELNFGDPDVLAVSKLWRKVNNERERTLQFFRFQKAADGTYFAAVAPLYNVLPLVLAYATDRFADQRWLLYDLKRSYGYYYDLREATEVRFKELEGHLKEGLLSPDIMDKEEALFQRMWKAYFQSIAIKERLNPRLQRQHMPQRFWAYMPEKRD